MLGSPLPSNFDMDRVRKRQYESKCMGGMGYMDLELRIWVEVALKDIDGAGVIVFFFK